MDSYAYIICLHLLRSINIIVSQNIFYYIVTEYLWSHTHYDNPAKYNLQLHGMWQ